MAPPWEDFVLVRAVPVDDAAELHRIDAGFLAQFASSRLGERLAGFLAPRYGLPKAGIVGTLEQQNAQVRSVHQDESGNGELVGPAPRGGHATNTQKGL